jgi:hypothetical protein
MVARADKRNFKELLDTVRAHYKTFFNQWDIIIIVNEALNLVAKTDSWVTSFILVNLRPSMRTPFAQWLLKHKENVKAANFFFKSRSGLYNATPACWKNVTEAERREVAAMIETFPAQWTSEHIRQLIALTFVKFDDVDKFRGCYLLSKEDPSVFVTTFFCADDEDNADESTNASGRLGRIDTDYDGFCFAPKALMDPYKEDRSNTKLAGELFCHMANYVACNRGHETDKDLVLLRTWILR